MGNQYAMQTYEKTMNKYSSTKFEFYIQLLLLIIIIITNLSCLVISLKNREQDILKKVTQKFLSNCALDSNVQRMMKKVYCPQTISQRCMQSPSNRPIIYQLCLNSYPTSRSHLATFSQSYISCLLI